jgi:hypothetical protein
MKGLVSVWRPVLAAAILGGALVASGDARADDDDHHGHGGAGLTVTRGGATADGTLSSVVVTSNKVMNTMQYRVMLVAAPDRHQSKKLTCSIAVGSFAEADSIRRQALDTRTLNITCSGNNGESDNAHILVDYNMTTPGDGEKLTIETRA